MPISLEDFTQEKECAYKDERYIVRDNGSVFRIAREGKRIRKDDNQWTFGNVNDLSGYLEISSDGIHRIIATAFHGPAPSSQHVAYHIDTNKRNNRPENIRWVTKLENLLLNPITAKRIARVCGSVEAFLENPAKFEDKFLEPNFKWMRTVTAEEGRISLERLLSWAKSDKSSPAGLSLDEWLFRDNRRSAVGAEAPLLIAALTPGAVQKDWKTPCAFPCCPFDRSGNEVQRYSRSLTVGCVFSSNQYFQSEVVDYAISENEETLWVLCKSSEQGAIKPWFLAEVTYTNDLFVHASLGSFFERTGAEKQFTLARGLEWTGEDSIDDYC